MSSIGGPNINKDDIMLHIDASNIKSYRGDPITNLSYNNGQLNSIYLASNTNWINSGAFTYSENDTDVDKPVLINDMYLPKDLRIQSAVVTEIGNQHISCCYVPGILTPSTQYTMSVWFRQNKAGTNQPYLRTVINNDSLGNFSYNENIYASGWPVNEWIYITATATIQSNETGLYLSNYIGYEVGDKIWYYGHQLEQNSRASNLTTIPRTTSNTMFDLTNNTNIIINGNLIYDNNFIRIPDTNTAFLGIVNASYFRMGLSNFTLSVWIKLLDDNSHVITEARGDNLLGYLWIVNYGGINKMSIFLNKDGNQTTYTTSLTGGQINVIQNMVISIDRINSTVKCYVNGILFDTITGIHNLTISPSSGDLYRIGYDRGGGTQNFNLYQYTHYNRSLSSEEVLQNFNAIKGRYGL